MKSINIIAILSIFALSLCFEAKAQNISPLYFNNFPQSIDYNPAFLSEQKLYISMPAYGKFSFNFKTSGFNYKDLINEDPLYPDSLRVDKDGFLKKLKKNNYFDLSMSDKLLGVGFKVKQHHFDISINLNVESRLSFTKSLFDFLVNGTDMQNKMLNVFSGQLVDATAYLSTSIGYAYDINNQWTVGARLKFYNGIANIDSKKTNLNMDFSSTDSIVAYADVAINTSMAFGYLKQMQSTFADDSEDIEFEDTSNKWFSNMMKNKGIGFDIGAIYRLNDKMTFSLSIIDIGYIKWKSNPRVIQSKDPNHRFTFSGVNTSYENIDDDLSNYCDDMADSLQQNMDLEVVSKNSYKTSVPTKIYLGYTWEFYKNMKLNVLYHARFINQTMENALMLDYSIQTKKYQIALSNIINSKFFNPGIQLSKNGAFMGAFIGVNINSSFNMAKTSGLEFYMGINILNIKDIKQNKVIPQAVELPQN